MPFVEYGEGNVKVPRCGMNADISPADSFGRRPAPVDESMKPPAAFDCAQTMFCDAPRTKTAAQRIDRILRGPTSMLPPRSSGPRGGRHASAVLVTSLFWELVEPQGLSEWSAHTLTSHAR